MDEETDVKTMKMRRYRRRGSPDVDVDDGSARKAAWTKSCEDERRVGWPAKGPGREPCDSGENSRRSALKYAPFQLPCAFHGAPEKSYVDA